MRQSRYAEAMQVMHAVRVDYPGARTAAWAESELARLKARGHDTPSMTEEEQVRRARLLVRNGPLDVAKATVQELLDSPLSGTLHAEVHYLAGRLARDEGRWEAAESYLRTAQLFPIEDVARAQHIENRANDMAETVGARDPERARLQLANLRAGRSDASIPTNRLVDMVRAASAAGLQDEVDGLLISLSKRAAAPSAILFEAAMAAVGTGGEELIIGLLHEIAKRPGSRYRIGRHLSSGQSSRARPAAGGGGSVFHPSEGRSRARRGRLLRALGQQRAFARGARRPEPGGGGALESRRPGRCRALREHPTARSPNSSGQSASGT